MFQMNYFQQTNTTQQDDYTSVQSYNSVVFVCLFFVCLFVSPSFLDEVLPNTSGYGMDHLGNAQKYLVNKVHHCQEEC